MSFLKKRLFIFDTYLWKIHIDPSWTFTPRTNSSFRSARGTKRDHIMDFQYPQDVFFLGKFDGLSESEASVKKLCLIFFWLFGKSYRLRLPFILFILFIQLFIYSMNYLFLHKVVSTESKSIQQNNGQESFCYELSF